ncbi:MAG: hypothetical protein DRJ62_05205 [Thermoprotei archaeon]|nr:MAG: hypothetical protein DRJ62_05205 [Thermoprotei archaeon]
MIRRGIDNINESKRWICLEGSGLAGGRLGKTSIVAIVLAAVALLVVVGHLYWAQVELGVAERSFTVKSFDGAEVYVLEKYVPRVETKGVVILLHPYTGVGHLYYDIPVSDYSLMDYLARHGFDVYAIDVRGFGLSDKPETFTLEDCARDVKAVVDRIISEKGVSRVSVVGLSFGSCVAVTFTGMYGELVDRLVLIGYPYKDMNDTFEQVFSALPQLASQGIYYVPEKASREKGPFLHEAEEEIIDQWYELISSRNSTIPTAVMADLLNYTSSKYIPQIKAPTLLIRGEYDVLVLQEDNWNCFRDLGCHEKAYVVLANAGHSAVREKVHLELFKLILGWLEE